MGTSWAPPPAAWAGQRAGDTQAVGGLCVPAPVQDYSDTHGCSVPLMPDGESSSRHPAPQGWAQTGAEPPAQHVGGPSQALVMRGPAWLSFCFVLINPRSWGRPGPRLVVCRGRPSSQLDAGKGMCRGGRAGWAARGKNQLL